LYEFTWKAYCFTYLS
jgi:hypothetical protein